MTKILVADDIAENRYLLTALLEASGFEVVPAADGVEALRLARSSPPDVIVTDIMMPAMDGFELCRQWKRDELLQRVPFVIYTATYTDPQDERLALSLGADRFLVKPQKPEALLEAVREVLEASDRDAGSVRRAARDDDVELLQQHNEALGRKLEKKTRDLGLEIVKCEAVEAALRDSERKFRLMAENALDVVWTMGFDGRFTYMSPSVEKLQGFTPAEALAMPLGELVGPQAYAVIEAELALARSELAAGRIGDALVERRRCWWASVHRATLNVQRYRISVATVRPVRSTGAVQREPMSVLRHAAPNPAADSVTMPRERASPVGEMRARITAMPDIPAARASGG
ncbi:MAG: response regulator [Polyangiaceae bacterium]|nr:response regulator [Polyangiaceae bacterium]